VLKGELQPGDRLPACCAELIESQELTSKQMSWPSFLINLDDAHARWAAASAQLKRLGVPFARLAAVNGSELTMQQIACVYDKDRNWQVSKAPMCAEEMGCYLSHIEAWRRIAEHAPGGFVFEDDFRALPTLPEVMQAISRLTIEWDIVKLYSECPLGKRLQRLTAEHDLFDWSHVPPRTLGYAINAKAAARLAAASLPFARPIDRDHRHWWDLNLRILSVAPSVLHLEPQHLATSTLEQGRRRVSAQSTIPQRCLGVARHLRDQIRYAVKRRQNVWFVKAKRRDGANHPDGPR
jgi:glycosyl transferase, family 25